jgi:hypothetical protein
VRLVFERRNAPRRDMVPGDLGIKVLGNELLIPEPVANVLTAADIRTGEEFVASLGYLKGALARELGWSDSQMEQARLRLLNQLQGVIAAELLKDQTPQYQVYGALDPAHLKRASKK